MTKFDSQNDAKIKYLKKKILKINKNDLNRISYVLYYFFENIYEFSLNR